MISCCHGILQRQPATGNCSANHGVTWRVAAVI